MTQGPHVLTPADIADLRLWAKRGAIGSEDGFPSIPVPYIVASPSDGSLHLHSQGRTVASGLAPHVMAALLYNERLEPGFCRAVCDPTLTIEEAVQTPASRAQARSRALARDAADRADLATQRQAKARRSAQLNPLAMNLDFLESL